MWALQSGSRWPIAVTANSTNTVLPKSPVMTSCPPSFVSLDFFPFCSIVHSLPCSGAGQSACVCAPAELCVYPSRAVCVCVPQQHFVCAPALCAPHSSFVRAGVNINPTEWFLQEGCRGALTTASASCTDDKLPAVVLPRKRDFFILFILGSNNLTEKWEAV